MCLYTVSVHIQLSLCYSRATISGQLCVYVRVSPCCVFLQLCKLAVALGLLSTQAHLLKLPILYIVIATDLATRIEWLDKSWANWLKPITLPQIDPSLFAYFSAHIFQCNQNNVHSGVWNVWMAT